MLAVVEVALFTALTDQQRALLEEGAGMVALKLDVLQRNLRTRELLEQVRTTEERTRLILESTAEGIFGVDTEGRITFVNPAACRMLRFTAAEMVGQPSHALIHHHRPDGREYPKEECPMFAAYKQGQASRIDDECLWRKDGAGLRVEYGATPSKVWRATSARSPFKPPRARWRERSGIAPPAGEVELATRQVEAVLEPLLAPRRAMLDSAATETPARVLEPSAPPDPARTRAAAAQLTQLLSEFDPSAADFIEASQAALRPLFPGETWTQFETLVRSYSFLEAQSQLEQALKNPPAR